MTTDPAKDRAKLRRLLASGEAEALRERVGMPRQELAKLLRVHYTSVYRWEEGRDFPRSITNVRDWLSILDTIAAELDSDDDQERAPAAVGA